MTTQNSKLKLSSSKFQVPSSISGFTLVETIVALGLLVAALVGPVSLITRGLAGASASKNKLIALHLAEEGIELARAMRDNNILCEMLGNQDIEWNSVPGGLGAFSGSYELDAKNTPQLDCASPSDPSAFIPENPSPSLGCDTDNNKLRLDSNGVYTYSSISGTPTGFSRCVRICSPPNSGSCALFPGSAPDHDLSDTTTTPPQPNDQMEVISQVFWTEKGAQKSFELRARLYNWR